MYYNNYNDPSAIGSFMSVSAALDIAKGIIDGLNHYEDLAVAYTKQKEKRFMMRQPASKRQLLKFIAYFIRMGFDTAKQHGGYCPHCGYLIIPEYRMIENDVKIGVCPMCAGIMSAEDRYSQTATKKKSLYGATICVK